MIQIVIFRDEKGFVNGVKATGHDKSAPEGENIVCAGVSTLVQTALLGVGKELKRGVSYKVEKGDFYFRLKEPPDELTEAVLETMVLGLREVQKIRPQGVHIKDCRG